MSVRPVPKAHCYLTKVDPTVLARPYSCKIRVPPWPVPNLQASITTQRPRSTPSPTATYASYKKTFTRPLHSGTGFARLVEVLRCLAGRGTLASVVASLEEVLSRSQISGCSRAVRMRVENAQVLRCAWLEKADPFASRLRPKRLSRSAAGSLS